MNDNQQDFESFLQDHSEGRQTLYKNMIEQLGGVDQFIAHHKTLLSTTTINNQILGFATQSDLIKFYDKNQKEIQEKNKELAVFLGFSSLTQYIGKYLSDETLSLEDINQLLHEHADNTKNDASFAVVAEWLTYESFEGLAAYFDYFKH